jgi:hypothetical protein
MEKTLHEIFPNEHFKDRTLYQFGYEKRDPPYMSGPAARNRFLFHSLFSGKGLFRAGPAREAAGLPVTLCPRKALRGLDKLF